jgi:hypothetical protein
VRVSAPDSRGYFWMRLLDDDMIVDCVKLTDGKTPIVLANEAQAAPSTGPPSRPT